MHGANRLGGNSLSDLLVFGRRAGAGAADFAKTRGAAPTVPEATLKRQMDTALAPFGRSSGENPFKTQADLQQAMQMNAGLVRDKEGLDRAVSAVTELKARASKVGITGGREYNPGWHTAIDLGSLLTISEAVVRAALLRTESRGGHTRFDFPKSDPAQERVQFVIKQDGDQMSVNPEPQPALPADLAKLIKEGA